MFSHSFPPFSRVYIFIKVVEDGFCRMLLPRWCIFNGVIRWPVQFFVAVRRKKKSWKVNLGMRTLFGASTDFFSGLDDKIWFGWWIRVIKIDRKFWFFRLQLNCFIFLVLKLHPLLQAYGLETKFCLLVSRSWTDTLYAWCITRIRRFLHIRNMKLTCYHLR